MTHRTTPTALLEAWGVIATPYRFTPNGEELIALEGLRPPHHVIADGSGQGELFVAVADYVVWCRDCPALPWLPVVDRAGSSGVGGLVQPGYLA